MTKRIDLPQRVKQYMEETQMSQTGDLLLVALSGGGDSVCLLCVLKALAEELGITLAALHVHHGIRDGEADEDAAFCETLCRQMAISCYVVKVDVPALAAAEKLSLEEAARIARYRELDHYRGQLEREYGKRTRIAVAHHREDQAETVLWNLFRGSGLRGLGGMKPINGMVIRPLLDVGKAEILEYLQENQLSWQQDSTNDSDEYTRNRIRRHILGYAAREINAGAAEHICQAAHLAGQADDYLRRQAGMWIDSHGEADPDAERCTLDAALLRAEDPLLQSYVLREAVKRCSGARRLTDVTARHVEALQNLLENTPGGSARRCLDLAEDLTAQRCYDQLILQRGMPKVPEEVSDALQEAVSVDLQQLWHHCIERKEGPISIQFGDHQFELRIFFCEKGQKIPSNQYTKWMNYDKMEGTLVFRTRKTGDHLYLPGGGRKTVKSYMIDEKIPAGERDRIPVIAQDSHVLWIAGYRLSEGAKVTENTQYVLEIKTHGG